MRSRLALIGLLLWPSPALAQGKPLLIPQVEGERLGRIIGRAIACGIPVERSDALAKRVRERVLAAVGFAFTEDRFVPALNQTIGFETSLPRPSDETCTKALAAFERETSAD